VSARQALVYLCLPVVIAGCATVRQHLPEPDLQPGVLPDLVLVDCAAALSLEPGGPGRLALPEGACDHDWYPSGVWPARLLRVRDGFAEVLSPGRLDGRSCAEQPPGLDGHHLRLFVPEERLVPTVAAPVELPGPDGSRVAAVPGTPLWPTGPGIAEVDVQGRRVPVRVDDEELVRVHRQWWFRPSADELDELPDPDALPWLPDETGRPIPVWSERQAGSRRAVTVWSGCTRIELRVPQEQIRTGLPAPPAAPLEEDVLPMPVRHLRLRDGAEVFLPSGERVGTRSGQLFRDQEVYWIGRRACIDDALPLVDLETGSSAACFDGESLSD